MSPAGSRLGGTSVGCTDPPDIPSSSATVHAVGLATPTRHGSAPQSVDNANNLS